MCDATDMDYFKIVATKERKGLYFSVVPHKWEHNNLLFWPTNVSNQQRQCLRMDAASIPQPNWKKYTCILKYSKVNTFEEALRIEEILSNCTDTESEETFKNTTIEAPYDCNDLFNIEVSEPEPVKIASPSYTQNDISNDAENANIMIMDCLPEQSVTAQISQLSTQLNEMGLEIKKIHEEYVKIRINLDNIYKICKNKDNEETIITKKTDWLQNYHFPLRSVNEIISLEADLRQNSELQSQMIELLSKYGGTSGGADASKVAYKITDELIHPETLTTFTWTGVSRKSDEKKAFQNLEALLSVLFKVLVMADSRHNMEKHTRVFRDNILKHAKKRCIRKRNKDDKNCNVTENATDDVHSVNGNDDDQSNGNTSQVEL